jgi:3-isopropylmalate/(R)-2-methylmalate dehydratase small subunit
VTPLTTIRSRVLPLVRDNIDTDIIIPSREIRAVSKAGLADGLFAGWRYLPGTRTPDPAFVLNDPAYVGAVILAGGTNFGCGSSREQAVWALHEYGFRVVVAPSFNSIFERNCVRNGVLPITLDPNPIVAAGGMVTVDLPARTITGGGQRWTFAINAEWAIMLIGGLDEIDVTMAHADAIAAFHHRDRAARPWAYLGTGQAV